MSLAKPFGIGILLTGATGAALLVGYALSAESYLKLVVLAVCATIGGVVLASRLRMRFPGLALLLVAAVLVPTEFTSGASLSLCLILTAFLCSTWLLGLVLLRRRVSFGSSRVAVAAMAFMAVALVSFVSGQFPWFPTPAAPLRAQIGGLALFLFSGGILLMVGHEVRSLAQLQRLTWLFIGAGAVAVMTSALPGLDFSVGSISLTNASTIGSGFWTWLVAMSVGQGLCNGELSRARRLALLAVAAIALARGLLLAFSWVSGWLPPLVAVAVILFLRFPRFTIGSAILLVAPSLALGGPMLESFMAGESYSWMTRLEALNVMRQVIERNPWLGFGPANYYHYTLQFPILGWYVRFNSHNNYIDLLAQTGVIGLLAFCWFVVEALRLAVALRSRVAAGFARAYVVGVLGGLVGALVSGLFADWIVPFTYNIGLKGFRSSLLFWFFLGGLLALNRLTAAARAPVEAPIGPGPRNLALARA